MNVIVGGQAPAPAETARRNILALNSAMFGLYEESGRSFRKNLLAQHPVILGLFTGAGGRFILYKPGAAPVEAPSVPIVYQLMKSVGHATMVTAVMAGPHIDKPDDQSWRSSFGAFRARLQAAARQRRQGRDPRGLARRHARYPRDRHRLHRRLPEKGRDLLRRGSGVSQKTGAEAQAHHRLGGADPGRPLDGRARRAGRRSLAPTGTKPTPPATRSMSRARTTSCSACWPSFSGRRRSTRG